MKFLDQLYENEDGNDIVGVNDREIYKSTNDISFNLLALFMIWK